MLVAQAPQNILTPRGSVVQTPNCWLHQPDEMHHAAHIPGIQQS